jgi:MFS family permease
MLLAGYVVSRRGWRPTIAVGMGLWACVYTIYGLASSVPELAVAQFVRGFAFAACTATALTMAIEMAPNDARARAAGVFQVAHGVSQVTGGYLGGPLVSLVGFRALFFAAAGAVLAGAAYVATSGGRERVSEPSVPSTG